MDATTPRPHRLLAVPGVDFDSATFELDGRQLGHRWSALAIVEALAETDQPITEIVAIGTAVAHDRLRSIVEADGGAVPIVPCEVVDHHDVWTVLDAVLALDDWESCAVSLDVATGLRSLVAALTVAWHTLPSFEPTIALGSVFTSSKLDEGGVVHVHVDREVGPTVLWAHEISVALDRTRASQSMASTGNSLIGRLARPSGADRAIGGARPLVDALAALDLPGIRAAAANVGRSPAVVPSDEPLDRVLGRFGQRVRAFAADLAPKSPSARDVLEAELEVARRLTERGDHDHALLILREVQTNRVLASVGIEPEAWADHDLRSSVDTASHLRERDEMPPTWWSVRNQRNAVAHVGYARHGGSQASAHDVREAIATIGESLKDIGSDSDPWQIIPRPASLFQRALAFATASHADQTDKAGRPYILHPVAVAAAVADAGEIAMCVALLHDVVEDTRVTIEEIEEEFGAAVAGPVALLTKTETTDYGDYLDAISRDPVALAVKLADMRHNFGRLDQLDDPETIARLRSKYEPRIALLEAAIEG